MTFQAALQSAVSARDYAAGRALCAERLRVLPRDSKTLRQLALVEAAAGNRGAAEQAARQACHAAPGDARAWSCMGQVAAMFGALAAAAGYFQEAVRIDPGLADGWHNLGLALRKLGKPEDTFNALKTALAIDDKRADTYLVLGALLIDSAQFDDALECFERAVRYDKDLPRARSRLAARLSAKRKVKRAESLFRQSVTMDPDHIEGWMGLARTLEDTGKPEAARAAYLAVLQRRPDHATALGALLTLTDAGDDGSDGAAWHAHAARLIHRDRTPDAAKALIGYGLAKHHDRHRRYRDAAEAGRIANAARRRVAGPLDRTELTARIDRMIETYTAEFFRARRHFGIGNDQPVFIVGLPRSGTTLTEQILSAHPLLHGAGELPDLAQLAERVLSDDTPMWQAALQLTDSGSRAAAAAYLTTLHDGTRKGLRRITDKQPLNLFQLAFAAQLFPGARVIHCRRQKRDNALSIWMENFNSDQRYATAFDDLAFFQGACERLMAHWREALPLKILEVRYEDVVADLKGQAQRLIGFMGVEWDPRCLAFHENDRTVQTPSRWQVRRPLYARSVERWRAYADHLPELLAAFPTAGQ
jgi:tetratricopeptide (TPR) repeat protein